MELLQGELSAEGKRSFGDATKKCHMLRTLGQYDAKKFAPSYTHRKWQKQNVNIV